MLDIVSRMKNKRGFINVGVYTRMSQVAQNYCVSSQCLNIYLKTHPKKLVSFHAFLRSGHLFSQVVKNEAGKKVESPSTPCER